MKLFRVAPAVAMMLVASSPAARADLIVNGGFENPLNAPPGFYVTYFGGNSFPGWSVGLDSVDVHHTAHTRALAGIQSLDLSGNAAGSITQTVPTVPGTRYILDFGYAGHPFHPYSGDAFAAVYWGGLLIGTVNRPPAPDIVNINWQIATYSVVATSSTTQLSFVSLSPNGGILLDEIHLNAAPVPEPSSALTMILGALVVGVFGYSWRRHIPTGQIA